ncbi:MAG: riboflavin synthase [Alphaproteobacteria bacterium]|nr:riboflavin synthase [Alphaproteobacteria bacterium]
MFTGIIQDVGEVLAVQQAGDRTLTIATKLPLVDLDLGASVACNGICLTVVEKQAAAFMVQLSAETLGKTTAGGWRQGTKVNLERSLRAGDELGGHLVQGHVDGTGTIKSRTPEGDSLRFVIAVPSSLSRYIAPKGAVTLDGVSLTINDVLETGPEAAFGVNIIPHTRQWTNFGTLQPGNGVNIEVDMMARYLGRLLDAQTAGQR